MTVRRPRNRGLAVDSFISVRESVRAFTPNETKISHRWRERAWWRDVSWSHGKLERTPASGWLHRLVRFDLGLGHEAKEKGKR